VTELADPLRRQQPSTLRLTIDGTRLVDALGRAVMLRGINAGGRSKLPPWAPFPFAEAETPASKGPSSNAPSFEEAAARYLDRFVAWGLGCVRLPFSWEALEPERGRYDDAYLERYLTLARAAGARGLRVIVDFHQDVFARPYAGDGFPLWTCPKPVPPPAEPNHHWFLGYVQNADVKRAFDRFWANDDGLMDAFEAMWRHMAGPAWNIDAVIGFEVINEPGWGSASLPDWGPQVMTPFYERMASVVREVAPGAPIFFDATGGDALSAATTIARPAADGMIFAPHFYVPEVIMEGRWGGDVRAVAALGNWAELGANWDLPVLLGEFGLTPSAPGAADYVRANYEQLDEHRLHGTLWECSTSEDDWNHEDMSVLDPAGQERPTVDALVRPYPAASARELVAFSYDADTRRGRWTFSGKRGDTGELVVPARCGAITVDAGGGSGLRSHHDEDAQRLLVALEADGEHSVAFALS
jgi:endoglycosylceramidase